MIMTAAMTASVFMMTRMVVALLAGMTITGSWMLMKGVMVAAAVMTARV